MIKQFSASVVVISKLATNADVLLVHHKKFGKWMIPGGHVELNESPLEAACREVKEETGLNVKFISFIHKKILVKDGMWLLPPEYLFEHKIPARNNEEEHVHMDFTYISVSSKSSQLELNQKESNDLRWFSFADTKKLNMFLGTRKLINEIELKLNDNHKIYEHSI